MKPAHRVAIMLAACAGLLGWYVWGVAGLPDFGDTVSVTGTTILHAFAGERHTTNAVTTIVFDYRGMDTLGEELILFISVVAVTLLLRERRDESEDISPEAERAESHPRGSDAVRALGVATVGVTVLLGLYVVTHGQLSPGGGFQGGVILAAAFMAIYAAGNFVVLRRMGPADWMEPVEAAGAAGLALLALGGLLAGGAFFHNFLPPGPVPSTIISGGTIPLDNVAVGIEVFGAMTLLAAEFLNEAGIARVRGRSQDDEG
ncbi:MAG TPA: hydrogen gas-evolving membrane-bound hydrogenase subunit E [Baekduia sp.]|nr:hydrogen gas-evolving membrane-bound hydrogenase subunit E [Baekduia sp.]